jgi:hypothetical protein
METACSAVVSVISPNNVTVQMPTRVGRGKADATRRVPLFSLDLVIEDVEQTPNTALEPAPAPTAKPSPQKQEAADDSDSEQDVEGRTGGKSGTDPTSSRLETPQVFSRVFGLSVPLPALAAAPAASFDKAIRALGGVIQVERQVNVKPTENFKVFTLTCRLWRNYFGLQIP